MESLPVGLKEPSEELEPGLMEPMASRPRGQELVEENLNREE